MPCFSLHKSIRSCGRYKELEMCLWYSQTASHSCLLSMQPETGSTHHNFQGMGLTGNFLWVYDGILLWTKCKFLTFRTMMNMKRHANTLNCFKCIYRLLECDNEGIINWNFCPVLSYATRFFSGLSWLQGGNQSLFPSQSRKDLRKGRWVTLFQYLVTHRGQHNNYSLGFLMENHTESKHTPITLWNI